MVPRFLEAPLRIFLKMLTIGICYVSLHCLHVILREYKVRVGNRSGDVEVDYNRDGVGLLSQDPKYRVWFKGGGGT